MNGAFEITHEVGSATCIVSLSEDLDLAVVPELRAELEASLESGCTNLVLDLSRVTYADSSALPGAILVAIH